MKQLFAFLLVGLTFAAHAELIGIDGERIFREVKFQGLETKCAMKSNIGCMGIQVLFNGEVITRTLTQKDFYLDSEDFGSVLDIEFGDRVSCNGGDQLKWPQRSHVHIRYCANVDLPIYFGKTFLFLMNPGPTAIEFHAGKREEFKKELRRVDLTFTYARAIMFRDRATLSSEKDAKKIAQFFQQNYAP